MTRTASHTTIDQIETVVVNPEDVIAAFKRNQRDATEQHHHVLRVSPPFQDDVVATLHASNDRTYYPSNVDPEPICLGPEAFVNIRGSYDRHRTRIPAPTRRESRSTARSDHGEDVDEETVEAYHTTLLEAWEQCVRTSLVNDVPLTSSPVSGDEVWAAVRYEEER